ncbi:MAG: hypothetical protein OXN94_11385 [Chloroflexota bacterium]|nr:hypothetical protein [Chloroflexota bacterium]MDE2951344.1 hypothetical protein [Chloroflexota bacterium]
MAKRRRKKPNISKAVLEQARQTAAGEEAMASETEATAGEPAAVDVAASPAAPRRQRRRRRDLQAVQLERRKDEGALDAEYVADLLANPTKEVSEEELRADYGFVIKDLRNMGILAAGLFVALVLISLLVL